MYVRMYKDIETDIDIQVYKDIETDIETYKCTKT
jgi:hypothetical protein